MATIYVERSLGNFPSQRDMADEDARRLADRAEEFNRSNRTVTTEQANDLTRALSAISAALGRIEQ